MSIKQQTDKNIQLINKLMKFIVKDKDSIIGKKIMNNILNQ